MYVIILSICSQTNWLLLGRYGWVTFECCRGIGVYICGFFLYFFSSGNAGCPDQISLSAVLTNRYSPSHNTFHAYMWFEVAPRITCKENESENLRERTWKFKRKRNTKSLAEDYRAYMWFGVRCVSCWDLTSNFR